MLLAETGPAPGTGESAPPESSDEALWARVAAGDLNAFETVVRRRWPGVASFLRGLGIDESAADDLAQETFVSAYARASEFAGRGSLRGWLFAIARNGARMWRRSRARERARVESRLPVVPAEPAPWDGEASEVVSSLLARLDEPFREVIVLCELQGFSYEEAAAALEIPVKTVSSRLFRARERLVELSRAYRS